MSKSRLPGIGTTVGVWGSGKQHSLVNRLSWKQTKYTAWFPGLQLDHLSAPKPELCNLTLPHIPHTISRQYHKLFILELRYHLNLHLHAVPPTHITWGGMKRRENIETLTYLLTPSNRRRSRVPKLQGGPWGSKADIHLTFSGPRLQRATGATSWLPSLAALGN